MAHTYVAWFADGRIVDAILAFMVMEALALTAYRRATGRGIAASALIANLAAGGALLLALKALLAGWGIGAVGAFLVVSFLAHLADLQRRWQSSAGGP